MVLFEGGKRVVELQGSEDDSTNNRMELMAALKALESLGNNCDVELFTDSRYVQQGITSCISNWERNGWLTSEKQPVKNRDLWESLAQEMSRHTIDWQWIKGHADDKWNDRADELAASARKKGISIEKELDGVQMYLGVTWKHSSGTGAWSNILCYHDYVKIIGGEASKSSANQLYLVAAIEGIKKLKRDISVQIFTKSGYLRDGLERWLEGWKKRDWRTRDDKVISNRDQWLELSVLKEKYVLSVVLVSDEDALCKMQEAKELAREFEK